MAKRDKYAYLMDELGYRLALIQSKADTAKGGGKARYAGEIEALEFAIATIKRVYDRRTKVLVCPNGHKFEVGLFKSVKDGIPCTECGTPAFKVLKKAKPAKPDPLPAGPTTAEIEDAALEHADQKQAEGKARNSRRKRK